MLVDRPRSYIYSDLMDETAFAPPCEIVDLVKFVNGICPFSGYEDCRDCISNEFDAECIWRLCNLDRFGLA